MMIRKSLLGLGLAGALLLGATLSWNALGNAGLGAGAPGSDGTFRDLALGRPSGSVARTLPSLPAGDVTPIALASTRAELDGDAAQLLRPAESAELTPEEQKQVDKLQKKLDKAEAKAEKAEAKLAKTNEALLLAEEAVAEAEALPDSPAQDKALAKALKKLAKLEAKLAKAQAKLDTLQALDDDLTAQIEEIDPDHFALVAGLMAPEQLTVVTAADEGQAAQEGGAGGSGAYGGGIIGGFLEAGGGTSFVLGEGDFPPDSDFNTDVANSYVYDPSMDVLSTVNQILCMMAQTKYDEMVNQGTYVAQIDESLCGQGDDSSASGSETGQSSGGQGEVPELWVVRSERADEQSEQAVEVWVPNESDGFMPPGTIRAKLNVQTGVSDTDPFGQFDMNFAMVPLGGDVDDAMEHGFLKTLDVLDGFLGFSFYMAHGELDAEPFPEFTQAEVVQANVNMFDDQSEGVARIRRQWRENFPGMGDSGVQTDEYLLAFNDLTVLRGKNGEQGECLSRTDFATNVWRYNLYHAQGEDLGQRVERNSGFGIQTADGKYGWIGYYGLWLPPNVDVENGDTVTQSTYGDGPGASYTVVSAPGKLIRNTRQTLTLTEADGETFTWWDFGPMGGGGPPPEDPPGDGDPPPPPMQPTQYKVEWNVATHHFVKVATFDPMTGQFTDLPEPEAINIVELGGMLNMWSESLGGSVSYLAGDTFLTYWKQAFVNGSDEIFASSDEIPLYGFMDCLDHGITGAEAETGDVFLSNSFEVANPHRFLFRKSDLTLHDDADGTGQNLQAVGLADGEAPEMGPFTWGMHSGPMLTSLEGVEDTFQVWGQPVFYTYETGHNSWNHYATVKDDAGDFVMFDPPLQFSYEHSQANDANGSAEFDGAHVLLSYNGNGDLFGIPMQPVDLDGDGFPDRWYPQFNVADGALMGETGVEYVVKAIQQELTLEPAPGQCTQTIDPVADLPLPEADEFVAPDIGPKPFVDEPPAVIAGVVQGQPDPPEED